MFAYVRSLKYLLVEINNKTVDAIRGVAVVYELVIKLKSEEKINEDAGFKEGCRSDSVSQSI